MGRAASDSADDDERTPAFRKESSADALLLRDSITRTAVATSGRPSLEGVLADELLKNAPHAPQNTQNDESWLKALLFVGFALMTGLNPVLLELILFNRGTGAKEITFLPQFPYLLAYAISLLVNNCLAFLRFGWTDGLRQCWSLSGVLYFMPVNLNHAMSDCFEVRAMQYLDGPFRVILNQVRLPGYTLARRYFFKAKQTKAQYLLIACTTIAVVSYSVSRLSEVVPQDLPRLLPATTAAPFSVDWPSFSPDYSTAPPAMLENNAEQMPVHKHLRKLVELPPSSLADGSSEQWRLLTGIAFSLTAVLFGMGTGLCAEYLIARKALPVPILASRTRMGSMVILGAVMCLTAAWNHEMWKVYSFHGVDRRLLLYAVWLAARDTVALNVLKRLNTVQIALTHCLALIATYFARLILFRDAGRATSNLLLVLIAMLLATLAVYTRELKQREGKIEP